MSEQFRLLHVVHSHVVVLDDAREEVVYFPCHVQDVTDAANTVKNGLHDAINFP